LTGYKIQITYIDNYIVDYMTYYIAYYMTRYMTHCACIEMVQGICSVACTR